MIAFAIRGEPVPFARAGANGKRRFTPSKQANYMNAVRAEAAKRMGDMEPFEGPLAVRIRAVYSVPDSWSQKKKDAAHWKFSKPDADNIAKIVKDAMNTIVFKDDAQVAELLVQKVYGPIPGLTVSVEFLHFRSVTERAA